MAGSISTRIVLRGDVKDAIKKYTTFGNVVKQGNKKIQNSFQKTNQIIGKMGGLVGGIALAGAFKNIISTAGDFQNSMARVKAITNASSEDFTKLKEAALEMGSKTIYSASQSAEALQELGMAGLNATDSIGALPQVLTLATAGSIELADAANIVTGVMKGMGLQISDTQRINDVLAAASTNAKTDITSLGEAFANAGSTANLLGINLEDTTTLIATMAQANINGAEAGNALKSSLLRLSDPTKEVGDALDKVGLSTSELEGYINDGNIIGFFDELRSKMNGMSSTDKGAILSGLFGKNQAGKMGAIIGQTAEEVNRISSALYNSKGAAQKMADEGIGAWQKGVKLLESAVEGLLIKLGEGGLLGFMTKFINNASSLVSWISSISGSFEDTIPVLYAFGTAAAVAWAALTGGISAIVTAVAAVVVGVVTYWNDIIQVIEDSINAVIDFANKFTVIRVALVTAVEYIKFFYKGVKTYLGFIFTYFKTLGTLIYDTMEAAWNGVKSIFTGDDYSFTDGITTAFSDAFNSIEKEASGAYNYLSTELKESVEKVVDAYNGKEIAHVKIGLRTTTAIDEKDKKDTLPTRIQPVKIDYIYDEITWDDEFNNLEINDDILGGHDAKIRKIKDEITDLNKEVANESLTKMASGLNDVFGDDTASKIVSFGQTVVSEFQNIMDIMNKYNTLQETLAAAEAARKTASIAGDTAETAVKTSNAATQVAANTAVTATNAAKDTASIPFGWIAIPGVIASVLAMFSALPKFESGGMVGGSSYSGDKILARLNSGEGVLTAQGISNAGKMLSGGSDYTKFKFEIAGDKLQAVSDNYNRKKRKR